MEAEKLMKNLLKQYIVQKDRKVMLEKKISFLKNMTGGEGEESNVRIHRFPFDEYLNMTEDEIDNELQIIQKEMSTIIYMLEKVDLALAMLAEYNEECKLIIEYFYIKNVRMEDICGLIHISRSSCYELRNKAIRYMSKIIF